MENSAIVTLSNTKPVELADLSLALLSLAQEYHHFSLDQGDDAEAKLYLVSIHPGSVVTELVALATSLTPIIEGATTITHFFEALNTWVNGLLNNDKDAPDRPATLRNLQSFVEPVVKDQGATWNIQAGGDIHFTINYAQANTLQNQITRKLNAELNRLTGLHQQVALVLTQAKTRPETGHRGVIESVYPAAVKVVFDNESLHQAVVLGQENPLGAVLLVDVQVETVNHRPVLYKIVAFHERLI